MEVHHHAHSSRKKWTHYLWEFIMLFLAVFCGFLAENFREHIIEKKRERQYIQTLISDIRLDTAELREVYDFNIAKFKGMDSLVQLIDSGVWNRETEERSYLLNLRYASSMYSIDFNDRTIKQLMGSGNMRLIHDAAISDSIMNYYQMQQDVASQGGIYEEMAKRMFFMSEEIFNFSATPLVLTPEQSFKRIYNKEGMVLMTHDQGMLKKYAQIVSHASGIVSAYIVELKDIHAKSVDLLLFLEHKYHLK